MLPSLSLNQAALPMPPMSATPSSGRGTHCGPPAVILRPPGRWPAGTALAAPTRPERGPHSLHALQWVGWETYEMPGVTWNDGVAEMGSMGQAAWFKDSEGNILCIDSGFPQS